MPRIFLMLKDLARIFQDDARKILFYLKSNEVNDCQILSLNLEDDWWVNNSDFRALLALHPWNELFSYFEVIPFSKKPQPLGIPWLWLILRRKNIACNVPLPLRYVLTSFQQCPWLRQWAAIVFEETCQVSKLTNQKG